MTLDDGLCLHPTLPPYALLRQKLIRAPAPIRCHDQVYDIMGVTSGYELRLRDVRALHRDVRMECLVDSTVLFHGQEWLVLSVDQLFTSLPGLLHSRLKLHLVDPEDALRTIKVAESEIGQIVFPSSQGDHTIDQVRHGIVRMAPVVSRDEVRKPLQPGFVFEARLRGREIEGLHVIEVDRRRCLLASRMNSGSNCRPFKVEPKSIAPRYKEVYSPDFGYHFDVDTFLYHEDMLRGEVSMADELTPGSPFGTISGDADFPLLTNGTTHLAVFQDFIERHTSPVAKTTSGSARTCKSRRRRLTILNLSMSDQGHARSVLEALVEFRRQNSDAEMTIVVSKLGPTVYQEHPDFYCFQTTLQNNRIHIDNYAGSDGTTRQIVHAKAVLIDDHVLFSTGAIMDTQPIDKADFSMELPAAAAMAFRRYTDEAILQDASDERRAEMTAELAIHGVVINDPVASLTYITRAQNLLIAKATQRLTISVSELVDPTLAQVLVDRAAHGVDVSIQVRELDDDSARIIAGGLCLYPGTLRLEDMSWWEPRPHFNLIVADDEVAYLGSAYLWATQRNMIHQGRSLENGLLLDGDAVTFMLLQLYSLGARARGGHWLAGD